ncbi:hypothetical protein RCZ04_07240 [Capnocytophaga sp. HP1101]
MGYYMFAYGVKTPEIKAVFGSKDEALLQRVKANDTFQNYAEDDENHETTQALTDIVMGNPYTLEGYHYGYAFIGICATLGEELPYTQEIKFWYETDLINQTLLSDGGIEVEIDTELFPADHFHPFRLPKIKDFPMISLLNEERLKTLASLLGKVHKTPDEIEALIDGDTEDDEDKGYSYEHITGLKENIAFCLDNGLEMVAFCH